MSRTEPDQLIRFRCQCGAVLTARANLSGRKGKCKTCGNVQVIPRPEESLPKEEAPEEATGVLEMCSVCQTGIEDDDERTTCDACHLPFHEECWTENLGCSAYGCTNVNALKDGPDIRVGQLPGAPPARPYVPRATPRSEDDDLPLDHLLLAASAIGTVVGFVTCGLPALLVSGLAAWRIAVNQRNSEPVILPVLALVLSVMGLLTGLCLSAGFWSV